MVRHAETFLDGFLSTRTKVRNASFTDSEVRNIFARSGESTTTLLPSAYRLAYFPRTPLLKSYSGSMSACPLRWMTFFISRQRQWLALLPVAVGGEQNTLQGTNNLRLTRRSRERSRLSPIFHPRSRGILCAFQGRHNRRSSHTGRICGLPVFDA